ncbi:hypothetical protein [Frankia sp. EAN1pec]|uniref:hypothetical protein n=1 Tax=Parafrankia sp. (strain EAN1pec) TaxID=298653 RepID=UPI0003058EB6
MAGCADCGKHEAMPVSGGEAGEALRADQERPAGGGAEEATAAAAAGPAVLRGDGGHRDGISWWVVCASWVRLASLRAACFEPGSAAGPLRLAGGTALLGAASGVGDLLADPCQGIGGAVGSSDDG